MSSKTAQKPSKEEKIRAKYEKFVRDVLQSEKHRQVEIQQMRDAKSKKKYVRITANGKTYTGVTRYLRSVFYPFTKKGGHGGNFLAGKETGILVHKHLNLMSRGQSPTNAHPLATAMMNYARTNMAITPIWGEYPCFNSDRKATIIDMLGWNSKTNRPCLIDWKTSYPERYTMGTKTLANLPKVKGEKLALPRDSPRNMHLLQVVIAREILRRGFKINIPVSECYVIHGFEKDQITCVVEHHAPCVFMQKYSSKIYDTFVTKSNPFK